MKLDKLGLLASRTGLVLRKNAPEILVGLGIVGTIGGTVMACKGTTRALKVMESHETTLQCIEDATELNAEGQFEPGDEGYYSEADRKQDLMHTNVETTIELIKTFAPAVLLTTAGIGCIVGSHVILNRRNAALVAAYTAVDGAFKQYRKRVIEDYGKDVDYMFKNNLRKEIVQTEDVDPETGEVTVKNEEQLVMDPNGYSEYAKFFDEGSRHWVKNAESNYFFLKCQQNYANEMLQARGHVFLNEVYDLLGIPRTSAGQAVGWVKGVGDDFVDFGIYDGERAVVRDFVNGYENSILLDFNVCGAIYDLI